MELPRYILKHIQQNNTLLERASKHAEVVKIWYEKQCDALNAEDSTIADEEFYEIQTNWLVNGVLDGNAIQKNLELLQGEECGRE